MSLDPLLDELHASTASEKGRAFEELCRWYLSNAPEYRLLLRRVWLWSEWPGRWGPDAGIDLIAETHTGEVWAIQAKAYDPAYSIRKADVDSFLSETGRSQIAYRLLIATTDLVGANAMRTLRQQEKKAGVKLLSQLRAEDIRWPASLSKLKAAAPKRATPRPHQRGAIRDVTRGLRSGDRGQLIMACGTGKTLTALWTDERLKSRRTLMLVPSLSLLGQTLRAWTAHAREPFDYLAVCSDDTVVGHDDFVEHAADLGLPVTTDAGKVASFLRRRGRRQVVFSTYQSSPVIQAAQQGRGVPAFDIAFADEAHRCAGPAGSDFALILDARAVKARRRVFMTATPRYFSSGEGRGRADGEHPVVSMDDEKAFGPVLHRLGFAAAIDAGLLSDYQVVVVGVDEPQYARYAERGELVTRDGRRVTDARTLARQIGLAKAMRRYDLRRVLSFHSRVAQAERFARELPDTVAWLPARERPKGRLWTDYVAGTMSAGRRDQVLGRLRDIEGDERAVLSNARCLGEGVDVPAIDGVAFIEPRRSAVDVIQATGRAIRRSEEKTVGTVVIPVFIEPDEDAETVLEGSAFKPVWDVVRALRAHDDQLAEWLDGARRRLGREGASGDRPEKIHLDLPSHIGSDFARAFDVRLVDCTTASWEFWFGLLEAFVGREGHAWVPAAHQEGGFKLGQWVVDQRVGRGLTPERRVRLEALPGWVWDAPAAQWEQGYAALQEFVAREGHARVPARWMEGTYRLGSWVGIQRKQRSKLTPSRKERLEGLPDWVWDLREALWQEGYNALLSYVAREGTANVTYAVHEDGYHLGKWVRAQRNMHVRNHLEPPRVALLEALPCWEWNIYDAKWQLGYEALCRFAAREGHARPPQGYREGDYPLGQWVAVQRGGRSRMNERRRAQLEALPKWTWDSLAARWDEGLRALQIYADREGHARVPQAYMEGDVTLGRWVAEQRKRRSILSDERRTLVESVPGWTWDVRGTRWQEMYELLAAYAHRTGTAQVPSAHVEQGEKLGSWVVEQRKHRDRLGDDQRARLEQLPGWSWDTRDTGWEAGFEHLTQFAQREGHAQPPVDHMEGQYRLGRWLANQRQLRRRLTASQRERLEGLPGWTWRTTDARWEEGYRHLVAFADRTGSAAPVATHVEDGYSLGPWVTRQRKNSERGRLGADHRARLEALPGWSWTVPEPSWEIGYAALTTYADAHGDTRVPADYVMDGYDLGEWVQQQRRRRTTLTAERTARLEALPGWRWRVADATWDEEFEVLLRYVEREGDACVPRDHVEDGFALGVWIGRQRKSAAGLSGEQRARLDEQPGWVWDARAAKWDEAYSALHQFAQREGHARPTQAAAENEIKIGQWVNRQRSSRSAMSAERRSRLEALPGWAWEARPASVKARR